MIIAIDRLASKDEITRNALEVLGRSRRRKEIFSAVNGKMTASEISKLLGISVTNCLGELAVLRDVGLIRPKGLKGRATIFEKDPFIKRLNLEKYFQRGRVKLRESLYLASISQAGKIPKKETREKLLKLKLNTPNDILKAIRKGEGQALEFKREMINSDKLKKLIVAFANTKRGGSVVFGVNSSGAVIGMGQNFEELDESVQNICRDGIDPPIFVEFYPIEVNRKKVYTLFIPPKPRKKAYRIKNGKFYIRVGTTVREPTTEEIGILFNGYLV